MRMVSLLRAVRVGFPVFAICLGVAINATATDIVIRPLTMTDAYPFADGPLINTINNTGLSSPLVTGDPVPAIFPTHALGDTSTVPTTPEVQHVAGRIGGAGPLEPIDYHLGAAYNLTGMAFWNYCERYESLYYNDRGVKDFTLAFSTDNGATYSAPISLTAGQIPAGPASGASSSPAELFLLSQSGVTDVRLTAVNNHGGDWIGFGEIAFTGSQVPEPSACALAGLAVLACFGVRARSLFVVERLPVAIRVVALHLKRSAT